MLAVRAPARQHRKFAFAGSVLRPVKVDKDSDTIAHGDGDVALDKKAGLTVYFVRRARMGRRTDQSCPRFRQACQSRVHSVAHYQFEAEIHTCLWDEATQSPQFIF